MSRSPTLEAMKADTRPGRCICCDERLPPRVAKPRIICPTSECASAYQKAYAHDRWAGLLKHVPGGV
jgi:hypothetical protein